MDLAFRVIVGLALFALFLFSCFGFLATFEPLEPSVQWTWRAIYAVVGIGSIAGIVALIRRR